MLRLHSLHYKLGCVFQRQGQLTAAAESYQRALSLQSPTADIVQTGRPARRRKSAIPPNDQLKVYNNLGCVLIQQEQWQAAAILYQQAIELQPDHAVLHSNLGRVLFRDSPNEAIAAYRRAIQLQPDFGLAHYNLGLALQHLNQHQAALECFEQALRIEPSWANLHNACAVSWMALGGFEQALESLRQAILPYAAMIEAYSQTAITAGDHLPSDHLSLAKASCGKFLRQLLQQASAKALMPDLAQTYWHWANVLTRYGGSEQYQRAETYYQTALRLQPQNLDLLLGLANCLERQQRLPAAVLLYRTLLIRYPDQPQIYIRLGALLEQQQQFGSAVDCYQTALRLNPQAQVQFEPPPSPAISRYWGLTQNWLCDRQLSDHYVTLEINLEAGSLPPPDGLSDLAQTYSAHNPGETCGGLNCDNCLKRIWQWFNPLDLGKGLYFCPSQAVIPVAPYPLFVAMIPQGQAWIVPQQNAWMVCNAVAVLGDESVLSDLSRAYPAQLPGCTRSEQGAEQTPVQRFDLPNQSDLPHLETITGRIAVLSNLSGNTYFHWIIDVLPRIELLRQRMDLKSIDWFLVNSIQHPFQVETLNMLGIPLDRIITSDQHPYIQATELVAPSFSGHFGWLEPWALAFLRRSFLDPVLKTVSSDSISFHQKTLNNSLENSIKGQANSPSRIYISRSDAKHRRILNESEVVEQLQSFGFVAVELEGLSFHAQVALFAQAEVIVAPHGSGLTNLVFLQSEYRSSRTLLAPLHSVLLLGDQPPAEPEPLFFGR